MARRRKLPRYKKTALLIAGVGVALGVGAVILWPQLKKMTLNPLLSVPIGYRVGDKIWNGSEWVKALTADEIDFVDSIPR